MKKYTLGIAGNSDGVVMIRKTKPEWQAGKLNFVGGKVEPGESYLKCMVREFREETGVDTKTKDWKYVGQMSRAGEFVCKMYYTGNPEVLTATTTTEEEVILVNEDKFLIDSGLQRDMISNILTIYSFTRSSDFLEQNATLKIDYP